MNDKIFPIGQSNDAYAEFFPGQSYLKALSDRQITIYTIHETRHTYISQLTMQNANPTIIKKIVGHQICNEFNGKGLYPY